MLGDARMAKREGLNLGVRITRPSTEAAIEAASRRAKRAFGRCDKWPLADALTRNAVTIAIKPADAAVIEIVIRFRATIHLAAFPFGAATRGGTARRQLGSSALRWARI